MFSSLTSDKASLAALHLAVYAAIYCGVGGAFYVPTVPVVVFALLLIWASFVDFRHHIIPDTASLLLVISGIVFALDSGSAVVTERILAGFFWVAMFWIVSRTYLQLRGWDGLGLGDVKLMAGIGTWTGFAGGSLVVLFASLSAAITVLILHRFEHSRNRSLQKSGIAFGPFLCISAWAVWLSGAAP